MKLLLLTISFIAFCSLKAQTRPSEFGGKVKLRNEVGLNLYNINSPPNHFEWKKPQFFQSYANGLMFKHHLNHFSLRVGFDYLEHKYRIETREYDNDELHALDTGNSYMKNLRLGIEKTILNRRFQIYAALDVLFSRSNFIGGERCYVCRYNIIPGNPPEYSFDIRSFGISPAVGLKYRFARHFSITAETSFATMLGHERYRKKGGFYINYVDIVFNPLRALTFNYHF